MKIIPFLPHGYESDSYLLVNSGEAALIDAGVPSGLVLEALAEEKAKLKYILLTHGHFDHTASADKLREVTEAKLFVHTDDAEMLADPQKSALALFFGRYDTLSPCDGTLEDGDSISLGGEEIKVIHTPGHSKGSVCYLAGDKLFTGDTLFNGGYGRFDLYGGDFKALTSSLKKLGKLDPHLEIYPGHGDGTTLGKALELLNFI